MTNDTPKSRWELVREELLAEIRLGRFSPGARLPSERDLAKRLGVSHPTVHKALSSLASEGLVTRHIGRGTFVTEAAGRRTGAVAMYFGKWANPFDDPIMFRVCAGISGACADRGLDLFFHTPQDVRFASPDEYVHSILERGCDGVVCVGHVRSEIIERLTEHLPTVLVAGAGRAFGGPVPRLVADQALASAAGARHLISLGRSRIALLGMRNSDFSPPDAIAARFREVLEEAGIDYDESLLSFTSPAVPEEFRLGRGANSGYWFDARLFSGPEHPDGVVAINPGLATNFYEFALERGILIGRDVSVVCVMDTHWTESVRPRCTSVDFLSEELGRQALEMLEEAIEGRIGPDELRIGATPVIVRESCGAPEEMRSPARSNAVEVLR